LKAAGGSALEGRANRGLDALASKNWAARRRPLVEQISTHANTSPIAPGGLPAERLPTPATPAPIDPDWLALQVVEAMPDNAILVDEGLTSSRQVIALRPHRDRHGYHALASGGIGWGLP